MAKTIVSDVKLFSNFARQKLPNWPMFHGVIQKITVAQFLRRGLD